MIKVLPREITNLRKLTDLDLSLNNMTTGTHVLLYRVPSWCVSLVGV
jgi:hypothetical protein